MRSTQALVKYFDTILQRDIEIVCDKKVIRKGTFILYTIKDYVITVIIKTPTSNKSYDIFYPFDVSHEQNSIMLDYSIEKLFNKNTSTTVKIPSTSNKFLNKILKIKYA